MSNNSDTSSIGIGAKIFLVIFGIVVALLMAEGVLRLVGMLSKGRTNFSSLVELRNGIEEVGHEQDASGGATLKAIIEPHADNNIIYDLRPNLDLQFQRAHVTTNSCGMRGPETSIAKPAHTYRIALLGDSFAFGWGVEQKESFAQRIEDNLNQRTKNGSRVEVLNFGVPGYSTFQEVFQFLDKGKAFQPDALLVFFIQNDFGPPFFIRNLGEGGIIPSSQLAQLAMTLIDPHAAERALQQAGLDPNRSLRILADYAETEQIPLYVAINPKSNWKKYYDMLWVLKQRKSIRFMKLRDEFLRIVKTRNLTDKDLTLSFDPHPSALRHAIYGDIMTPYFMDAIDAQP